MNIGISTANFYPQLDTEDIIELYGKNNIKYVEIFLNTYYEMEEDYIKKLKEGLDKYSINCSSIHVMSAMLEPWLFDLHRRRREDFFKTFRNTLKLMEILDTKVYTFHGPSKYIIENASLEHIADCYNRINYAAGEKELYVAQENVVYMASGNPNFIKDIKEHVKYPMHFTLDVKQVRRSNYTLDEFINAMGTNIVNLHLSDGDSNNSCLNIGEGNENFKEIFKKMENINYKGRGILELYRKDFKDIKDLKSGLRILEKLDDEREY